MFHSEKLIVAVKIKEQEKPILSSGQDCQEPSAFFANTYTVIIRGNYSLSHLSIIDRFDSDEYVAQIQLGGKYHFVCYSMYDPPLNQVVFEVGTMMIIHRAILLFAFCI